MPALLAFRLGLSMVMTLVNIFFRGVIRDREGNSILIGVVGSTVTVTQKAGSLSRHLTFAAIAISIGRLLGVETTTASGNDILSEGSRVHVDVFDVRQRGTVSARASAL
jgi:hypothetical protein